MFHSTRKFTGCVPLSALVLLLSSAARTASADASADLLFFAATTNEKVYRKSPGKYRPVVIPPSSLNQTGRVYYVERNPALRIPATEVESVVAEKNRPDPFMDVLTEEVLRSRGKGERLLKDDPDDNTLTFTLTAKAGAKYRKFANAHLNELYEMKFAGQSLGVIGFLGPFEGNVFYQFASRDTINRLKKSYPRLKVNLDPVRTRGK